MTITIADVLQKIDKDLAWRGPNDRTLGHVVLEREQAEYLRAWAIRTQIEVDGLRQEIEHDPQGEEGIG